MGRYDHVRPQCGRGDNQRLHVDSLSNFRFVAFALHRMNRQRKAFLREEI